MRIYRHEKLRQRSDRRFSVQRADVLAPVASPHASVCFDKRFFFDRQFAFFLRDGGNAFSGSEPVFTYRSRRAMLFARTAARAKRDPGICCGELQIGDYLTDKTKTSVDGIDEQTVFSFHAQSCAQCGIDLRYRRIVTKWFKRIICIVLGRYVPVCRYTQ